MDNQTNASQFAALEEAVASVVRAADEAAELLHVLAAVAGGLPDLQRALAEYRGAYPLKTVAGPALPVRASAPLSVATPAAGNSQVGNNEPNAGDGVAPRLAGCPGLPSILVGRPSWLSTRTPVA